MCIAIPVPTNFGRFLRGRRISAGELTVAFSTEDFCPATSRAGTNYFYVPAIPQLQTSPNFAVDRHRDLAPKRHGRREVAKESLREAGLQSIQL